MDSAAERFDFARKKRGLSFNDLSEIFGITQDAINKSVKRGKIKDKYLRLFADNYMVSLTWLMTGEGQMDHVNAIMLQNDAESVESKVVYVPLVHRYAYAGYLSGFDQNTYMETLPKEVFNVDKEGKGNYLAFEIKGDSMDDGTSTGYRQGEIALCRELQRHHWDQLHINQWDFIIVHKTEGILLKRITQQKKNIITCHSLNNQYQDFTVDLNDVAQLFNVIQTKQNRRR